MGTVPVTYIDWDYENEIAIRYERLGECNQCGDCCLKTIHLRMVDGDKWTHGGSTTDGEGRWSEIETEKRDFVKFFTNGDEPSLCLKLINNLCSVNGDKPWCCAVWPTAPADIETFPNCSYSFNEVGRWKFDE